MLVPEKRIVRTGTIMGGQYVANSDGYVELRVDVLGQVFFIKVHPDTASIFHCGKSVTLMLTADQQV